MAHNNLVLEVALGPKGGVKQRWLKNGLKTLVVVMYKKAVGGAKIFFQKTKNWKKTNDSNKI